PAARSGNSSAAGRTNPAPGRTSSFRPPARNCLRLTLARVCYIITLLERWTMKRLAWVGSLLAALFLVSGQVKAQDKPVAVATFSILADLTQRIAGDHVQVLTLVGPNGDAHVFEPGPKESAELADSKLLIANGLGFEPWLQRLEDASGFKGRMVIATDGVMPLKGNEELGPTDPHAFQDLANAQIYAANIEKGLSAADPAHAADYKANAD